jgi:transcriptional regulator with GAF, ATPase, and Fis domain
MSQNGADHDVVDGPAGPLFSDATMHALYDVVSSVHDGIEAVDFTSLMLGVSGEARITVISDSEVLQLDELQIAAYDGPAIQSLRTGRICRIASSAATGQWPEFREACRRRGIMSAVTFPLAANGSLYGALNLYSRDYHAFGPEETRRGRSLAARASLVISSAASDDDNGLAAATGTGHDFG